MLLIRYNHDKPRRLRILSNIILSHSYYFEIFALWTPDIKCSRYFRSVYMSIILLVFFIKLIAIFKYFEMFTIFTLINYVCPS